VDMAVAALNRRSLVKSMWSVAGDAHEAVLPGVIAPDSHVEFVFHLGNTWRMRREGQPQWSEQPRAFVYAQTHGALRFDGEGKVSVIAFRVSPIVASSILGRPLSNLWNEPVSLRDLVGADADALLVSLSRTEARERFALLHKWIESRLADWSTSDWNTQRLFDHVMWQAPWKPLESLSRQLGWSARGLRRVFAQRAGLSPKEIQLAARHLDACALLRECPELEITEIAGHVGFFDHAAFTHSFHERLGMTPTEFRNATHAFYERRP